MVAPFLFATTVEEKKISGQRKESSESFQIFHVFPQSRLSLLWKITTTYKKEGIDVRRFRFSVDPDRRVGEWYVLFATRVATHVTQTITNTDVDGRVQYGDALSCHVHR